MSHLEEYKEARQQRFENPDSMQQYYNSVQQRNMPADDQPQVTYDADQLMEYFEDKFQNEEDFAERTRYYFKDLELGQKKVQQYQRIANNENNMTSNYTRRYGNHYAWKRKQNASSAVGYFREMNRKIAEYANDDMQLLDNYTKYLHK